MFKKIIRTIAIISLLQIIVGGLELADVGVIYSQTKYLGVLGAILGGATLIACSVVSLNMRLKRLNLFMIFIFINLALMLLTSGVNIYSICITALLASALIAYVVRYNIIKIKI